MYKFKKWLCRKIGHKFDLVELTALDIMQNGAINKEQFKGETIDCKRCNVPFSYTQNMVGLYENEAEMDLI